MASMRFDLVLESLYGAVGQPTRWPQALSAIADYAGGTGGMLAYHDLESNYAFLTVGRLRDDLAALYVKEYASNPGTMASRRRKPGELVTVNEMAGTEAIRRSALYADIFVPQRIADVLTLAHPMMTGRGSVGGVAITLTAKQADRSSEVTRRMQRIAPHIMRAVELSFQVAEQRHEASQTQGLLQALSSAAFLLDSRGRILLMNALAEGVLRDDDGLSRDPERRLIATSPGQSRRLESVLRQALRVITSGGETFRDAIVIERMARSSRYLVLITPLAAALMPLWDLRERAQLLVQVVDPGAKSLDRQKESLRAFHLTAAETHVAALVAEGLGTPAVAAELGVSQNTVRTQLGHVFDKTGVHSQAALARLVTAT